MREILRYLEANDITLPSGGRLSVQRFQALGIAFGAKSQSRVEVRTLWEISDVSQMASTPSIVRELRCDLAIPSMAAELVLRATNDLEVHGKLTYHLLSRVEAGHSFDQNPIYFILHEPIYCSG